MNNAKKEVKIIRDYIKDKGLITLRTLNKKFDNIILKATLFDLLSHHEIMIHKGKILWSKSNPKLEETMKDAITVACTIADKGKCSLVNSRVPFKEVMKKLDELRLHVRANAWLLAEWGSLTNEEVIGVIKEGSRINRAINEIFKDYDDIRFREVMKK